MALPVPLALTQTLVQEPEEAHTLDTQREADNEIETGAETERVPDISTFVNIKSPVTKYSPRTTSTTPM